MPFTRLKDRIVRPDPKQDPVVVDAGEIAPGSPWAAEEEGVRVVRHYSARPRQQQEQGAGQGRDVLSGSLLSVAGVVIAASAVGAGYVSYGSQKLFAVAHLAGVDKGHHRASIIAALPDAGWIAMALVGLVAALLGRSSLRARVGVLLFFALSLAAQVMYAPKTAQGDWDSQALLVAVIAPIALAWMLETLIVEVRRWAAERRGLEMDESPIITSAVYGTGRALRAGLRFPLWLARLALAPRETGAGVKDWFLDEAPLAPGRTRASMRADEALARAGTAEEIAEQAKQQAAALVEQARTEAAAQVEQIRAEAEQTRTEAAGQAERARREADERTAQALTQTGERTEQTRAEAQRQVEQMRAQMAAQLEEMTRQHEQQAARQAQAADARVERIQAEAAAQSHRLRADANAETERLSAANAELSGQLDRLRAQMETLSGATTAKARLHALYEQMGRDGDSRYLDPTKIREMAKELGPQAGLQSVGTADAYIREYIATKTSDSTPVRGRGNSPRGEMIVNGS